MLRGRLIRRTHLPYPLELLAVLLARLLYRVRSAGAEAIPATGGVLLIANHLSYADVIVLQLACPRPVRYVGYGGLTANPIFAAAFRWFGVISIRADNPTAAIRASVRALEAGAVVGVFPEGQISRTGQLMPLKPGFAIIARRAGVPVVPVFHDGLWGTLSSFSGNRYLWKRPQLRPTPVFVAFGAPIPPGALDLAAVRRVLLDLGARAFEERPILQKNLGREIARALAGHPRRIAVIDRTAGRRELSGARLFAAGLALSRHLRRTVPARRVGIVLPPGAGAFVANLGVLWAGKIPVNLNFTAGRSAIESSLRASGIDTVLSADPVREKFPGFPWPAGTLDLRAVLAAAGGPRALLPWLVAAHLLPRAWAAALTGLPGAGDRAEAALLFTSGSAGEPKGVPLTHRNVLANCAQISSLSILPPSASLLGCLPIFHSFGFTVTLWYPLLNGLRVATVPSPLDSRLILDVLREEKITVLVGAPTFVRPLGKKARPGDFRFLDLIVTGAEKLPDDLRRFFHEKFHLEILQGYGLTETSPVTNVNQPNPPVVTPTGEPQVARRAGSVGRLLPGMTARIRHPGTGEILPETDLGLVELRGANVFGGYLGDDEGTRGTLREGWFTTGDLGRFDPDGFLFIEGRLSRFSKVGGEMVPHGTIEQHLVDAFGFDPAEAPAVLVTGVPDEAKGEALVILTTADLPALAVRERLAAAGLPALWIPKEIFRVERLPLLGSGKLDLCAARKIARERRGAA